jgi:hypothetical protein
MSNGVIIVIECIKITKLSPNASFACQFDPHMCLLLVNLVIECVRQLLVWSMKLLIQKVEDKELDRKRWCKLDIGGLTM